MDKWEIVQGDCLALMKELPNNYCDVVFTSPPYNDSGRTERDIEMGRHIKYKTSEYREDWFEWQKECITQMLRVTKKYVLYNVQALLSNKRDVYRLIGEFSEKIHTILIWYKPNAQPQPYEHRIGNSYEMVFVLRGGKFDGLYCNAYPYNNVIVKNINADRRYSSIHKAVMSQGFADEIIKQFTLEGELVLDPFCGLATTGIACVNQGRRFLGFELDEEYAQIARERLFEDTAQMFLPGIM